MLSAIAFERITPGWTIREVKFPFTLHQYESPHGSIALDKPNANTVALQPRCSELRTARLLLAQRCKQLAVSLANLRPLYYRYSYLV